MSPIRSLVESEELTRKHLIEVIEDSGKCSEYRWNLLESLCRIKLKNLYHCIHLPKSNLVKKIFVIVFSFKLTKPLISIIQNHFCTIGEHPRIEIFRIITGRMIIRFYSNWMIIIVKLDSDCWWKPTQGKHSRKRTSPR